jgi:hypothetical protein
MEPPILTTRSEGFRQPLSIFRSISGVTP